VKHGENILLADTPERFAECCLRLLENQAEAGRITEAGWELVRSRFGWDKVTEQFEEALLQAPAPQLTS
jgi:glycosyltransferase involved in cell wall biosynthesis